MSERIGERPRRRFDHDVDGILLLDKPVGMSSNRALQRARSIFRARKAGHAGSLDPLASGMLPIGFGQATKICGWLLDAAKTYRSRLLLGVRTATGDAEGVVLEQAPVPALEEATVRRTLAGMVGDYEQVPPMHSALKHEGKRLYVLARRGQTVERSPRQLRIHRLELLDLDGPSIHFEVHCSKGTYVRTLGEDIARELGTIGHLGTLRRTAVEPFAAATPWTLHALEHLAEQGVEALASVLLPVDAAFPALPRLDLDVVDSRRLMHGQSIRPDTEVPSGLGRAYGPEGRFLGLIDIDAEGRVHPRRLFVDVSG